jgi:hypothetical protein
MRKSRAAFTLAAIATFAVQAAALLLWRGDKGVAVTASNGTQLLAAIIAALAAISASRRSIRSFEAGFWRQLCYSFTAWAVAQFIWCLQVHEFTAVFDDFNYTVPLFFFSVTPFAILLTRRAGDKAGMDWVRILDSLQIVLLLLAAYIWFFYIPYQIETNEELVRRTLDHMFIFRNVTLWLALFLRTAVSNDRNERRLFLIAGLFMTLYMTANQLPTFALLYFGAPPAGWMDLFWTVPFLAVGVLAAYWSPLVGERARSGRFYAFASAQITPSLLPLVIVALSAYMAPRFPAISLAFVISSFVCYSVRLAITQFKQDEAKHELAEAEERFRSLFHQNALPMWVVDRSTNRFLEVNEAAIQRYGYVRDQFFTKTRSEISDTSDLTNLVDQTISRTRATAHEEKHRTAIGEIFDASVSSVNIEFAGKDAELCTIQDISERKKLEHQLRQAQKMEAVGTLAGGIAHDFNNLLTIITGYSQVILERAGHDEQLRREMQQIEVAANKATALIRQLLAFSRRQLLQPQVINLESVVSGVEKMLRRLIGENVDLVVRTTGTIGTIKADPGQIEQILLNLAVNARDAMEFRNGGRLTFELQNVDLDEEFVRENVGAISGACVMLAVSDTGCGMSAETRARIFEPFFTTKGSGGSGLGLATVYGIVQQSGGYITVQSTEGRGTTFRIFLPRVEGAAVAAEGTTEAPPENTGFETVLLVEDDDGLRALTRRVLLKHGYQVLEASRTSDAEIICREHPGKIHLLLTDVIMPGLSGKELSSRLTSIRPEMIVLYMSGYADTVVMKQGVEESSVNFIPKPFTPSSLSQKVREVLDAHFGKPNLARPYLRG